MNTTQIYTLVNSITSQAMGAALASYDANGLISLGNAVLSSNTNTEAFLNTLVQRIGRTIFSYRAYKNKLGDMVRDNMEWGAIVQKIKVKMPSAVADQTFNLTDGQSIDMYVVSKPQVDQKLFVTRAPYSYFVTIQRKTLKEAFTSAEMMGGFITYIFGEVRNKMELTLETLGRAAIANRIAATGGTRVRNLVTEYNALKSTELTAATAMYDSDFMRYASAQIRLSSKRMTDMSTIFNEQGLERFTPYDKQVIRVVADFEAQLESIVLWQAFRDEYVKLKNFSEVNYWQSQASPMSINMVKVGDESETATEINNIVAVVYDYESLGTYKTDEETSTTPYNARGRYTNTFWFGEQLWFNDLSENFVYFTLN